MPGPCPGCPSLPASLCLLVFQITPPQRGLAATRAEVAPLPRHCVFLAQTRVSSRSSCLPVRQIPRFPSVFVHMLSGHLVRVGNALGSGDRVVNQTDRSPPSGAHGLACVCARALCVRACVNQTTMKSVHLLEYYEHLKRAWAVTLRRWESWEASEQRRDVPISGLYRIPLAACGECLSG